MESWAIVGLGNPGPKYAFTRHNIGFMLLDWLAQSSGQGWSSEHQGLTCKQQWSGRKVLLLKPQTFMNLSGSSVQPLCHFYRIPLNRLVVIHDEVDLPFGKMKFQKNRGHGGHNGVRDISEKMGSADYIRLRMGIGRPAHPEMAMTDHVLGNFSSDEQKQIGELFTRAKDGLFQLLEQGFEKTSTGFNR